MNLLKRGNRITSDRLSYIPLMRSLDIQVSLVNDANEPNHPNNPKNTWKLNNHDNRYISNNAKSTKISHNMYTDIETPKNKSTLKTNTSMSSLKL
jgi:hypothetical protein